MQNFGHTQNELRYTQTPTPACVVENSKLTVEFLKRKLVEYGVLRVKIEALSSDGGYGALTSVQKKIID